MNYSCFLFESGKIHRVKLYNMIGIFSDRGNVSAIFGKKLQNYYSKIIRARKPYISISNIIIVCLEQNAESRKDMKEKSEETKKV